MKTGFKATYDFICLNHKFEIGKTYELPRTPVMCKYGFHYCKNPINVLNHYSIQHNFKLLEIEDLGECIHSCDKSVTNKLRVIREIPKEEYYQLFGIVNNELTIKRSYSFHMKHKYDQNNNLILYKNSNDYSVKYDYDQNNNLIFIEDSNGWWEKRKYDQNNNLIFIEDSNGCLIQYDEIIQNDHKV